MSPTTPERPTAPRKGRRLLLLLLLSGIGALLATLLLQEKKPAHNSPAYRSAHGIVEGRTNALRVGVVVLRFPPAFLPNPYSADDIVPGQADSVAVDLDLASWFDPPPLARSHFLALVQINIDRYGVEDPASGRRQLAQQWKSVTDKPALGLREYVRERDNGGWGYRMYVPLDGRATTPSGGLMIYSCSGPPGGAPDWCRTRFQHPRGPHVQYYLSGHLLPRWANVHAEVLRTVDSFMHHKGKE